MYKHLRSLSVIFVLLPTLSAAELYEKSLEELFSMETELKATVGSRSGSREFSDAKVPIKVITNKEIENSGLKKVTELLRYFIGGFNSPMPAIKDGSDHISLGTLRGLNPDQLLVLVNGKRLHTSSLIHVNDTVGRGSTGVDFNTIPVAAIEHIEVLSDGAAAQYGSDAIAGVINIILKSAGHASVVSSKIGSNYEGGGNIVQADMFHSLALDYDGFVNVTANILEQSRTNQEREGNQSPLGQPDATDFTFGVNTLVPQNNDVTIYSHMLFNYRDSDNNAFFRDATNDRNNIAVYPNGFLPNINLKMMDISLVLGVAGEFSTRTSWDASQTLGYNEIEYQVSNSLNDSIGVTSPSTFDSGGLELFQATTNLDVKHEFESFNLAGGLEFRYEGFGINAGEVASYINGAESNNAGAQGFPGFQPDNEVDVNRKSMAAYIQFDKTIDKFSFEIATRLENYSDFGSTSDYKLSLAYRVNEALLLRSSASTGFRAPSLAQSHYSSVSTQANGATTATTATLRTDDSLAMALGAEELQAEESLHFTSGFVYKAQDDLSLSVDYFYTEIDDRIMLSGNIDKETQSAAIQNLYTAANVETTRFFTNAVNTQTQGIDLSLEKKVSLENDALLSLRGSYSYAKTKIKSFNSGTQTGLSDSIEERERLENIQPKDYIKLFANYELNPINIALNITRVGKFEDVYSLQVQTFAPQWTSDLDISYLLSKKMKLAVGGTNIFNSYPDKWNDSNQVAYSRYSPSGFNGAFYYVRASYEF